MDPLEQVPNRYKYSTAYQRAIKSGETITTASLLYQPHVCTMRPTMESPWWQE